MKNSDTSKIVDNILRISATGTVIGVGLVAPQTIQMFDKPVQQLFNKLDYRERERRLKEIVTYMRRQGYLIGSYEHGLQLSKRAKKRLDKSKFDNLHIETMNKWDHKWRLVFFDIPEINRVNRNLLTHKLRSLGFQILQQSIWIHPFNCKEIIYLICAEYEVKEYVTYVEISHIDNESDLRKRFHHILR